MGGGELLCLDKGSGEALAVIVTPRLTVGQSRVRSSSVDAVSY